MSTITKTQQKVIATVVKDMVLQQGLGTRESTCSIAAINLALTGELTDTIPDCMSIVIGNWILTVQDTMPSAIRNSSEWKTLLPLAAGTGRTKEKERLALITAWMWDTVLPTLQPIANKNGYGIHWLLMTTERTSDAARSAAAVAKAAANAAIAYSYSADTATVHANASDAAAYAAMEVTTNVATYTTEGHAARAAKVASYAIKTDTAVKSTKNNRVSRTAEIDIQTWTTFDPCLLLQQLIEV